MAEVYDDSGQIAADRLQDEVRRLRTDVTLLRNALEVIQSASGRAYTAAELSIESVARSALGATETPYECQFCEEQDEPLRAVTLHDGTVLTLCRFCSDGVPDGAKR